MKREIAEMLVAWFNSQWPKVKLNEAKINYCNVYKIESPVISIDGKKYLMQVQFIECSEFVEIQ